MAKGRPELPAESWYADVATFMVREDVPFSQACQALGIKFATGKMEESHQNRKSFQKILWRIKNTFYQNIGGDPTLTKEAAMGLQWKAANNLAEAGDFDKVATAVQVLAKMAGWLKEETPTNVFATLNQSDIDSIKKRLAERIVPLEENCPVCGKNIPKAMMGRHLAAYHPQSTSDGPN